MERRVLVAMSGGVDSSTAAALLKEEGFEVTGVTMKLAAGLCCDIASALAVCRHLGISHRVIDVQAEFSRHIVDDFVSEYMRGRTPNPCIRCNDLIKFKLLLEYAMHEGFDYLATGHYARIERDEKKGIFLLKRGIDHGKDQSYFLYRMTQRQLARVLFPLGGYKKSDVRRFAEKMGLPSAERSESQDVCFIPGDDYRAFLKEYAAHALRQGELILTDGRVVGRHEGIAFYTVGQRRGLGVSAGERLYVVRIEPSTNRVVLGRRDELLAQDALVSDVRFLPFEMLEGRMRVMAKMRYRSPLVPAIIAPIDSRRVRIVFDKPVSGVCPGQAAVFYDGDTVIGGGIIEAR